MVSLVLCRGWGESVNERLSARTDKLLHSRARLAGLKERGGYALVKCEEAVFRPES
jgi:hypothetical protein